jgi:hypothetical protein
VPYATVFIGRIKEKEVCRVQFFGFADIFGHQKNPESLRHTFQSKNN